MEDWVKVFIVAASAAILMQMLILLGMYLQFRDMNSRMSRIATDLHLKVDPILGRLRILLDDVQPRLSSMAADAAEIAHVARGQAHKVDRIFTEGIERLRLQIIRADQMLTGVLEHLEESGEKFGKTLWGPVRQASAIIQGVKAGLEVIRGQQRSPERSRERQDEELFI